MELGGGMRKALITGIFGQDGSYICEILSQKGYEIHGITRKDLSTNSLIIKIHLEKWNIFPKLHIVDLNDLETLRRVIITIKPDEIYHTAAFHTSSEGHLGNNKDFAEKNLFDYNLKSTSNLLYICYESLRATKILTAGSCLMFDDSNTEIQSETTPFKSKSLYGLAKIAENNLVKYYRNKGLFACTAILYNHESERRGDSFVTKKIVKNMVALKQNKIDSFSLGNINIKKDWGYAKDYAEAMINMLGLDTPKDLVLSSGSLRTIREWIEICAQELNIKNWQNFVKIQQNIIDRNISTQLFGDNTLAKHAVGLKNSLNFCELIRQMISWEMGES